MAFNPNTQLQTKRGWLTQHDIKHLWHIKKPKPKKLPKMKINEPRKRHAKSKTNKKKKQRNIKQKKLKANAATFPPPHFGYQQLMVNTEIRHLINPF